MKPKQTELSDIDTDVPTLNFDPDHPLAAATDASPVDATEAALSATVAALRERDKAEASRYVQATDSEYWLCLCFETRAQKEEFLSRMGLEGLGDKHLNGLSVAKRLGVTLTARAAPWGQTRTTTRLTDLAVEDTPAQAPDSD